MAPEITILNRKTIGRKLKKFGVVGLIFGILYASQPFANKIIDQYHNWKTNLAIESAIEDYNYSKANEVLALSKERLNEKQINELEARIKYIHPDILFKDAQEADFQKKILFLERAYQEYKINGKEELIPKIKEQYISTSLLNLTVQQLIIEKPKIGKINKKLNALLENPIVSNGTTEKIDKIINRFYFSFCDYITNQKERKVKNMKPIIINSIEIGKKINSEKIQDHIPIVLETYGNKAKKAIAHYGNKTIYGRDESIKLLNSLKELEILYNYKIKALDVDRTIRDRNK